ncbi:MAG: nitrogen fixation protein [Chromatiaceae bacterium]|nr:nitrogen fixation protein [Chromatiaceae bacterium]
MRIAITSQNFKTITGHAGKTRRFLVYETDSQCLPTEVERIDLPAEMSLHAYHGEDHPLFLAGLESLITQGAGQGFVQRLSRHGIRVFVTSESDPVQAASRVAAGVALAPGLPHDHEHDDEHAPGHNQGRNLGQVRLAGRGQPAVLVQPKSA